MQETGEAAGSCLEEQISAHLSRKVYSVEVAAAY